jgi:hypothetical protein
MPPYGYSPTDQISLTYLERQKKLWSGQASLRRSEEEAEEEEEKIRLKQYVSLRSKGRHNYSLHPVIGDPFIYIKSIFYRCFIFAAWELQRRR